MLKNSHGYRTRAAKKKDTGTEQTVPRPLMCGYMYSSSTVVQ